MLFGKPACVVLVNPLRPPHAPRHQQPSENLVTRLQGHGIRRIVGDAVGSEYMLATRVRVAGLGGSDLVCAHVEAVGHDNPIGFAACERIRPSNIVENAPELVGVPQGLASSGTRSGLRM